MIVRHESFYDQLTAFAGYLRDRSFVTGIEEVQMSLLGLTKINIGKRSEFISVLKITYCGTPNQWKNIEAFYEAFLKEYKQAVNSKIKDVPEKLSKPLPSRGQQPPRYQLNSVKNWLFRNSPEVLKTPLYSYQSSNEYSDLSDLAFENNFQFIGLIRELVHCLAKQKKSKKKDHQLRGEINLRELIRSKFIYGDELLRLVFQYRPKIKTKMVLLCDVSRSMDLYSHFLSQFIFHLQNSFHYQATYVFNTKLHLLGMRGEKSWQEMKGDFSQIAGLWSEGTKIGTCLRSFIANKPNWFDRQTKVVIFSDGWDKGELDLLEEAMVHLTRISGEIIWLNPVLKSPEAETIAGIQIIKAYVDLLAPLYNLATLQELVEAMRR